MNKKFLAISEALKNYPHTVIHKIITDKSGRQRRILVSPRLSKNLRVSEPPKDPKYDPSKYFWNQ